MILYLYIKMDIIPLSCIDFLQMVYLGEGQVASGHSDGYIRIIDIEQREMTV